MKQSIIDERNDEWQTRRERDKYRNDSQALIERSMKMAKVCTQCGLPDLKIAYDRNPISIDEDNVCVLCKEYNQNQNLYTVDFEKNQRKFSELCNRIRGRRKYDAVLLYTGGKDSGYAAYYLSKILKLKVLALTWDNGFFGEMHLQNLTNLINKLGVDHQFVPIGRKNLAEFYRNRFVKLGRFCGCTQPAMLFCAPEIAKSEAPLVVTGASFGQQISLTQNLLLFEFKPEQRLNLLKMLSDQGMGISHFQDPGFFNMALLDVISGEFSDEMVTLLKNCIRSFQQMRQEERYLITLSLIYSFDHQMMSQTLSQYGWKKPDNAHQAGHTSCIMEPLNGYIAYKQEMFNLDYLELATERRWGRFSKELFESVLPTLYFYNDQVPKELDIFLRLIDMSRDDFEAILVKKPFAQAKMPEINWNLVDRLELNIRKEQLQKMMELTYDRVIP
jgi:hypothetical protein